MGSPGKTEGSESNQDTLPRRRTVFVAQVYNLLYRRLAVGIALSGPNARKLPLGSQPSTLNTKSPQLARLRRKYLIVRIRAHIGAYRRTKNKISYLLPNWLTLIPPLQGLTPSSPLAPSGTLSDLKPWGRGDIHHRLWTLDFELFFPPSLVTRRRPQLTFTNPTRNCRHESRLH